MFPLRPVLLPVVGAILVVVSSLACADLVAVYSLDEDADAELAAFDAAGSNHGTIIGLENVERGFASPRAALGSSYDFGPGSGLNLGAGWQVRPADRFTISFWFRPSALGEGDRLYETLLGTGHDGNGIRIALADDSRERLRVLIRDGNGTASTSHTHSQILTTGTWYFFAVRYDSALGERTALRVTLLPYDGGGFEVADLAAATESPAALQTGPLTFHDHDALVAASGESAPGANGFVGAMDDVAFFQTGDAFGVLGEDALAAISNEGALAFDPPGLPPTIGAFTADRAEISSGSSVTLSWDVSEASTIRITPGLGELPGATGDLLVVPNQTTVYTLVATNEFGTVAKSVEVVVDGQPLPPRISEFVADNSASLLDGDGNSSDWIEIHNPNLGALDLAGYFLTDDREDLQKWAFPAGANLQGDEYLVVFASGQEVADYVDARGKLHTNFSLRADGEYLALVASDGATILDEFAPAYPAQHVDISYGVEGYFSIPTPRASNDVEGVRGFVADTRFDVDRGFFTEPFSVTITTATPGARIYYTTDGSAPSPSNGDLYLVPVPIRTTTILRAAAFKDGWAPTNIDTQSYMFLEDVLAQPNDPAGLPASWAGHPADYEMDPEVVNDPAYADELIPALKAVPTLSLAMDSDDFFGSRGLYQNPRSEGSAWERPVSAEFFVPDQSEAGFQIDAGLRIQGGSSRDPDTPKHSLSLRFRKEYGTGKLRYPLFEDAPYGDTAVEEFDFLQLRSGYNFGWVHRHYYQARHAQYNRDQFANDLHLAMGNVGIHGRWAHLYINGIYWGIYHIHERPDADYMAAYFGGDPDDYDAINSGEAKNGSLVAYNTMIGIARGDEGDIADPRAYEKIKPYLDIDSFIDYMLMNFYIGNRDWDGHNWRAAGNPAGGVPFRFFPWDSEFAVSPNNAGVINSPAPLTSALTTNVTGKRSANRPTGLHRDLMGNSEYLLRFADRVHEHLFHRGPLSRRNASVIWRARSDVMDEVITAESARWGDFRRDVEAGSRWQSSDYDLYTKNDSYLPDQRYILGQYLTQRAGIVLNQLRTAGLYPATEAPSFAEQGGVVPESFELSMTTQSPAGRIYYTLDGSDPRTPDRSGGSVSPEAVLYSSPVPLTGSGTVNARVLDGGEWSALNSAFFLVGEPARAGNLVVSEIMYNPAGSSEENEFIELMNISTADSIELARVSFDAGIRHTFPDDARLGPGERVVLRPGDYEGNLDNAGERLRLVDHAGAVIEEFRYNDRAPWPESSDGDGFSLVRILPERPLDPNLASNWRSSTQSGGNPQSTDAVAYMGGDLLAYALGPAANPVVVRIGEEFALDFPRNLAADDVQVVVEVSTDLIEWKSGEGVVEMVGDRNPGADGISIMRVRAVSPIPVVEQQFLRLRVTLRQ